MKNRKTSLFSVTYLCRAAVIAALYAVLTYGSFAFGLASGVVQFRLSEALAVLAFYTPAAIPGLTVGCLLANFLTGSALPDLIAGPAATLVGAVGAYFIGKAYRKNSPDRKSAVWFSLGGVPNFLANVLIVPWVCLFCYTDASERALALIPYYTLTVGAGELVCGVVLGTLLLYLLYPVRRYIE